MPPQAHDPNHKPPLSDTLALALAALVLLLMGLLAGGAARRESITVDEVAHVGAGVSYLQKLDMRMNEEHPPAAGGTGVAVSSKLPSERSGWSAPAPGDRNGATAFRLGGRAARDHAPSTPRSV
jgi:hypothetical protein